MRLALIEVSPAKRIDPCQLVRTAPADMGRNLFLFVISLHVKRLSLSAHVIVFEDSTFVITRHNSADSVPTSNLVCI